MRVAFDWFIERGSTNDANGKDGDVGRIAKAK
jgi:hypothetical protein